MNIYFLILFLCVLQLFLLIFKTLFMAWLGCSVDWSAIPYTKMLQVCFSVRAHTYIVGSIPGQGVFG